MISTKTNNATSALICLLILIGLGISCQEYKPNTKKQNNLGDRHKTPAKIDKLTQPNEDFFLQRAYPDFDMPPNLILKRLEQVQKQIANKHAKQADTQGEWLIEGPSNIGGRINTIAVHPTNENIIYAGSARGGIHKTTNGGTTWSPIFDEQPYLSIGAITISPHDPNTIYVGTGDVNISSFFSIGNGVYKSTNGGSTWQHLGLDSLGIISNIIVSPSNPNTIYVAAMGDPIKRNEHRGLYRSTDGGLSWQKILFVDEDAGIIDMVMSSQQPNVIYAASWNRIRNLQETITYEEDSKIWKTTDGGDNWSQLTQDLPDNKRSRIGLTISELNPNRLAAVYVDSTEALLGIYISDNGGASWTETANSSAFESGDPLGNFGWYFGKIEFHPADDDQLFLLGVDMYQSLDGGYTWELCVPEWWYYTVHADKHDLVFDASNNLILGTDGGVYKRMAGSDTWNDIESIPNTQFYRVAVNPHQTNQYCGGAQDNGTTMGNANMISDWPRIFGGDGFKPIFNPLYPHLMYVEVQYGAIFYSNTNGSFFDQASDGIEEADRRNWDMPYMLNPNNNEEFYAGTYRMYKSNTIDPPLYFPISDDLTDGNIYGDRFHNITTIDQSALTSDYLYVGTSDGNVWRSLDEGQNWQSINNGIPDRYITSIKASPHILNTVYVAVSGYKGDGHQPHVFKSNNNGTDWEDISSNLPQIAVNDILILPEDTTDQRLFAATDAGIYYSLNGGTSWERLGNNMPVFSIFDIDYDPQNNKLVAATFARSIMSFDLNQVIDFDDFNNTVSAVQTPDVAFAANFNTFYNIANQSLEVAALNKQNLNTASQANIQLYALNGKLVTQNTWSDLNSPLRLSCNNTARGIYVVNINMSGKNYVHKVCIW